MREIKFRVWDKSLKYMHVCGEDVHDNCWYDNNNIFHYYNLQNGEGSGEHGDYILMQYTGLKDKNGKEIYEGDIVRDMEVYLTHQSYVKQEIESVQEAEKYRYFGNVAVVEFCTQEIASCGCCYQEFVGTGFKAKRVDLTCCEVIGNIYDNPELLEEDK